MTLELNSKSYRTRSRLDLFKLDPFVYVGGTANYHYSFVRGFTGALSRLLVNGRQLDLDTDARLVRKLNVEYSSTCSNAWCNNRGVCVRTQNRVGYKCLCDRTDAGANCELAQDRDQQNEEEENVDPITTASQIRSKCMENSANVCKNGGRCSLLSNTERTCDCHIGFSGLDCSKGLISFKIKLFFFKLKYI